MQCSSVCAEVYKYVLSPAELCEVGSRLSADQVTRPGNLRRRRFHTCVSESKPKSRQSQKANLTDAIRMTRSPFV